MSDCDDGGFRDQLPGLMHDRLAPLVRASVEAHVASCADCATELDLLRTARAAFARVPTIDTSRIAAAVIRETGRSRTRSVWQRPAWRIAAAISVISIGGLSLSIARSGVGIGDGRDSALVVGARTSGASATSSTSPDEGSQGDARTLAREAIATPARLTFGGGLTDLSDDELRTLIASVDRVEATPAEEPEPIAPPIGAGGASE